MWLKSSSGESTIVPLLLQRLLWDTCCQLLSQFLIISLSSYCHTGLQSSQPFAKILIKTKTVGMPRDEQATSPLERWLAEDSSDERFRLGLPLPVKQHFIHAQNSVNDFDASISVSRVYTSNVQLHHQNTTHDKDVSKRRVESSRKPYTDSSNIHASKQSSPNPITFPVNATPSRSNSIFSREESPGSLKVENYSRDGYLSAVLSVDGCLAPRDSRIHGYPWID